ncbi:C4-dicarboxylate ABC transporter [Thermosyntropha sp.]|uniref:SLAC1 family transporter n=1 Tax=Thermosyntropha sp. TaxID=2740820 RepID=UPI0025F22BFE|nr:C4-dicarboxylate ABC transporter [Thermosyntropha sp.]MBO8158192.1 C4-dicarboxylate ABC transporter [Thermosyntropha sp.]
MLRREGIIKNFSPAWFAAVMGTGGLANVVYIWGKSWIPAYNLGVILAWLTAALFVIFLIPWILRWILYYDEVKKDLYHPLLRNFFATMPIAIMVVATNVNLMGKSFFSAEFILKFLLIVWIVGILGAFLIGVWATFIMMKEENTSPQMMNFAWFIPPVGNIIIPLVGSPLVAMLYQKGIAWANTAWLINLTFYGVGFFLFIFVGSVIFNRLVRHALSPAGMTPSFWILLGPVGVGVLSLMGIADTGKMLGFIVNPDILYIFAFILWGFGFWAFVQVLVLTIDYVKQGSIPFSLSWWAFVFPLAVYTMSALKVGHYFNSGLVHGYAGLLTLLLFFFWVISFAKTLKGIGDGSLFIPHTAPSEGLKQSNSN